MNHIEEIIDYILPFVRSAGEYALQVQSRVKQLDAKMQYENAFGQALTAADVSVQNFIEVALLAAYPTVRFFGEEEEKSYNKEYFNAESSLAIYLDPIDGTRYYMDGHKDFNIILSFLDTDGYCGGIIYMPWYQEAYIVHEGGVYCEKEGVRTPCRFEGDGKTVVTYNIETDRIQDMLPEYTFINVGRDYTTESPCLSTNSILNQRSSAIIATQCSVIDWGVFGYMMVRAGGEFSDFQGRPVMVPSTNPEYQIPEAIVCVDSTMAARLKEALCSQG